MLSHFSEDIRYNLQHLMKHFNGHRKSNPEIAKKLKEAHKLILEAECLIEEEEQFGTVPS